MSDERAITIREQRNALLSNLGVVYPAAIEGEKLFRIMLGWFPEYSRLYCFKDLYYLEDKNYVVRKGLDGKLDKHRTTDWKIARWALTALGNEVANRLIEDPALEL